jgi:hypothetical protein
MFRRSTESSALHPLNSTKAESASSLPKRPAFHLNPQAAP